MTTTTKHPVIVADYFAATTLPSLEQLREERERREAVERVKAREEGILIGRQRERDKQRHDANKAWSRGFIIGLISACIVLLIGLAGADYANAANGTRIGSGADSQRVIYKPTGKDLPPGWRVYLEICKREQPAKGWGWAAVAWKQTKHYSFPGGCGLTTGNYEEIKHHYWPATMDRLSPRDQLWACFFLYWKYARIGQDMRGSYESGQRYGSTVWDVHDQPGLNFYGFRTDGETKA